MSFSMLSTLIAHHMHLTRGSWAAAEGVAADQVQAEKAATAAAEKHGLKLISICPSLILGPVTGKRGGVSVNVLKVC